MKFYHSPGACSLSPHIGALEAGLPSTTVRVDTKGRDYLMGSFTVTDAYLFTVLGWARYTGPDFARWPVLRAYVARIAARPHVQEALRAEGLLK